MKEELIKLYTENKDKIVNINETPILHLKEGNNNIYIQVSHEEPFSMRKVVIYDATFEDFLKDFSDGPQDLEIKFEDSYYQLSEEEYSSIC